MLKLKDGFPNQMIHHPHITLRQIPMQICLRNRIITFIFMLYFTSAPSSCCWGRGKFKCSWDKDTASFTDCPITNHLNLKKMKGLSENIVNFDNISIYEWHLNLIGIFHQNFFGGKSHILDRKEDGIANLGQMDL